MRQREREKKKTKKMLFCHCEEERTKEPFHYWAISVIRLPAAPIINQVAIKGAVAAGRGQGEEDEEEKEEEEEEEEETRLTPVREAPGNLF